MMELSNEKQPFYIAVCDDVQIDTEEIAKMTEEICKEEQICLEIACFERAENLLDRIQQGRRYDLLLIDVLMPGLDGMELARVLRDQKEKAEIVFISCNREMALQGYEVSAARYLAKPLDKEKLREAILFCYGQYRKDRELLLPINGSMRKVAPKDIYFVEIVGRKCRIRLEKEEWDASLAMVIRYTSGVSSMETRCFPKRFMICRMIFKPYLCSGAAANSASWCRGGSSLLPVIADEGFHSFPQQAHFWQTELRVLYAALLPAPTVPTQSQPDWRSDRDSRSALKKHWECAL